MILDPVDKTKIVSKSFPLFSVQFVSEFRYLGHVLTNNLRDDTDVNHEIRNMYMRTNMLIQRFTNASRNSLVITNFIV